MGFGQLYGGAIIGAIVAIIVAAFNARANRQTKAIDAHVATAELQSKVWNDLLANKDRVIARLELEIQSLERKLAACVDQADDIVERDAIIDGLLRKLRKDITSTQPWEQE